MHFLCVEHNSLIVFALIYILNSLNLLNNLFKNFYWAYAYWFNKSVSLQLHLGVPSQMLKSAMLRNNFFIYIDYRVECGLTCTMLIKHINNLAQSRSMLEVLSQFLALMMMRFANLAGNGYKLLKYLLPDKITLSITALHLASKVSYLRDFLQPRDAFLWL